MESAKLKNFIIILLLLLNLFFLFFVGYQEWQSRQYEASTRESTMGILKNNGITVKEGVIPWEDELSSLKVTRDRNREAELARELLGEVQSWDVGASTTTIYEGEGGKWQVSRGGQFSLHLTNPPKSEEWEESTLSVLRGLDFQGQVIATKSLSDGGQRATIWQVLEGHPVFNCQVEATWEAVGLTLLEGIRLTGQAEPDSAGETRLETPTLLIRFLDGIQKRDAACGEILSITPGYQYNAGLSTYATLAPAWYLETDVGDFILDCITGELTKY